MNTIAEKQPICEEVGCEQDATSFDRDNLLFKCPTHQDVQPQPDLTTMANMEVSTC